MSDDTLTGKKCVPCEGSVRPLGPEEARGMMARLDSGWVLNEEATRISRRLEFKGFAPAVLHANLAAWLAEREGHHPDLCFGWGYLEISYSTHAIGGLSENDFICAAKFDALLEEGS